MPSEPDQETGRASSAMREALSQLITWRRDVRRFKTTPVDQHLIRDLLRTAQLSPSVGNSQPWRFVMVTTAERRAAVQASFAEENAKAAQQQPDQRRADYLALKLAGLVEAPVQIAVFCDRGLVEGHRLGRLTMPETLDYSVVCAVHALWLLARAEGLGLGWVSILDPVVVTAALDVPLDWKLIAYLCLGYPQEEHIDPELVRHDWQPRVPAMSHILQR